MIPKTIHYCWFGGAEMPPFVKNCIKTWTKVLPDYKQKCWTEKDFDVFSVPFTAEAYKAKKWAFVADYVRLYALYTEGGIYMDTDVKVMKSFDEFLKYNFFSGHQIMPGMWEKFKYNISPDGYLIDKTIKVGGLSIMCAVMGSVPGLPYIKDCLSFYEDKHLVDENGNPRCEDFIINNTVVTPTAVRYGYRYVDEDQLLDNNMLIKKSNIFVGNALYLDKDSYAIHLCDGSWHKPTLSRTIRNNYPVFYKIFVGPYMRVFNKIQRTLKNIGK